MALSRKQLVDYFFDEFPQYFQGERTYWYEPRGTEDEDFTAAFGRIFNGLSDSERQQAADFLFDNAPEQFEGEKEYWYTDRGAENEDFIAAFGRQFTSGGEGSDPAGTPPGGDVETTEGARAEETRDEAGVGGKGPQTVSILYGQDMEWFFDPGSGKWYVSYKLPSSDRRVVYEASGEDLDAVFGQGMRPAQHTDIAFTELTQREDYTFGGDVGEVAGTGSFEAHVQRTIELALDEGILPSWAKDDPAVMDLVYVASAEGKSQDWLIDEIAKLPSFQQRFPGLDQFETLGLNTGEAVASFLEFETGLKKLVQRDGGDPAGVTPGQVGGLIAQGHSLNDVEFVYGVFDTMEQNRGALESFNAVLEARGAGPLSEDDWFEFMAGRAPREMYDIWEEASLHRAAQEAGLNMGVGEAMNLAARTEGHTGYGAALEGLQNAAAQLLNFRTEIALDRYDLDQEDLIDLSMGLSPRSGRSQAEIGRNIERAVRSAQANTQAQRINPFKRFTQEGVPQQASLSRARPESA